MKNRFSPATFAARLALVAGALTGPVPAEAAIRHLEFLGEARLEPGSVHDGAPIGGLSGLAWDDEAKRLIAISDDQSFFQPARFFWFDVDLADGRLDPGDVRPSGLTYLKRSDGEPFAKQTVDPEGLALAPGGTIFLASEGHAETGVAPFVREFTREGEELRSFAVDKKYLPRRRSGVRHNFAFESLTLSPSGRSLFTATENALVQDGPAADLERASPSRILRFDPESGRTVAEYLYWTDPVARPAATADGLMVAGLVELLAFSDDRLLALERSYSAGVGNTIRLYSIDLAGATDISSTKRLDRRLGAVRPAEKELLLDLDELGIGLDNVEGLSFGPRLADGRQTLLLVSDDNFNPVHQVTQFLAFAWSPLPLPIAEIQGAGHRSPWTGSWVFDLEGTVTAVRADDEDEVEGGAGRPGQFALEQSSSPDGIRSRALFVRTQDLASLALGDRVAVAGRIEENGFPGRLTTTTLVGGRFRVLGGDTELPKPVRLGAGGLTIPGGEIDDDGLTLYQPGEDTIDFFESLEGMRVELAAPRVVGPGDRFGGCVVEPAEGNESWPRTARGGLLLTAASARPALVPLSSSWSRTPCRAAVGDRFSGAVRGVLAYEFGSFRLLLTEPLPALEPAPAAHEPATLAGDEDHLTIASYNVENLDPGDSAEKISRVARSIARDLGAPDLVALQEIQDSSGPTDDGTVSADRTFEVLIAAIEAAGGPTYGYHQLDPENGADGGQPGGNIRVGYLFRPDRVRVVERTGDRESQDVLVGSDARGPLLVPNPGKVAPKAIAFLEDETRGYAASRKPLTLEVEFAGRRVFLVNAHLKSKRGDDPVFGARQPPRLVSEEQRSLQAAEIRKVVEAILVRDPGAAVVVLGDMNDHEFRAPLEVLAGKSLVNLVERLPPEERYTYVYQGVSQVLDHILVSRALALDAEIDIVHINADASHGLRASDHDPLVARLRVRR